MRKAHGFAPLSRQTELVLLTVERCTHIRSMLSCFGHQPGVASTQISGGIKKNAYTMIGNLLEQNLTVLSKNESEWLL